MADKKATPETSNLSLQDQLISKRNDLLNAKKGLLDNTLQNPHIIKSIKKDIARLLTKINQEKGLK